MERFNKALSAAGVILLLLAAFFSISLMLVLLDFGTVSHSNIIFLLGHMLATAYGFSSVLIPVFLLIAATACFSGKWTSRKAMRLLTGVVPFFTAVLTETICTSILEISNDDYAGIKVAVTIVLGAMLIVIEYLGAGIIADKLMQWTKDKKTDVQEFYDELPIDVPETDTVKSQDVFTEQKIINAEIPQNAEQAQEQAAAFLSTASDDNALQKTDKAFDNIFDYEKTQDGKQEPIISQEEFAALTANEDIEELVWDLPAVQNDTDNITQGVYDLPSSEPALVPMQSVEQNARVAMLDPDFFDIDINEPSDEAAVEQDEYNDAGLLEINKFYSVDAVEPSYEFDSVKESAFQQEIDTQYEQSIDESPLLYDATQNDTPQTVVQEDAAFEEAEAEEHISLDEMSDKSVVSAQLLSFASDVFADMDKDVRSNLSDVPQQQSLVEQANEVEPNKQAGGGASSAHESLPPVKKAKPKPKGPYKVPADLLTAYEDDQYWIIDNATKDASAQLKETLNEFNIEADVIGIKKGPVVTMFEILPAPGVKLSKIAALQDNIALRLAASSVRIVAPIPGKQAVGIEIPNKNRSIVSFREIIEKDMSEYKKMAVPVILGKDILGKPQIIDLVKMPHLLIAGATGSGKSVCVNSMILSILYKRSPQEVKLILIDPKIVELKLYNDIPHLLVPVVTESKKAFQALQWALCEMERRYALLDSLGCRDIASYNKKIAEKHIATEKLPYIVIIIDEFADLMATTGKELESTVARLAAMSRAIGIHLVLATQRPSIDVITGLIKANIPSRIAFMVASKMDSRIIIDQVGAEKLLGRGDMLYASAADPFPVRIQGTFVSDKEVEDVVEHVKKYDEPDYIEDEVFVADDDETDEPSLFGGGEDPLYNDALEIVMQAGKASASYIQRRLKIGYNRAARLVEDMEARGIVGPANGSKPREIIHMP